MLWSEAARDVSLVHGRYAFLSVRLVFARGSLSFSASICRSRVLQWEQERSAVDWPRIEYIKTEKAGAIGDAPTRVDPAIPYVIDDEMVHHLPKRINVVQES
jgi:hypothetical protein